MFPIPSDQMLSFKDIADYWSGEIKPSRSQQQLRDHLSKAWWRGDLVAANGPSRVHLLRGLFAKCSHDILFVIPGVPEPPRSRPLEDGGMVVFLHPRVPLPNAQPATWTDTNCAEAFNAIAEAWDERLFGHLAFEVPFIVLTVGEFIRWLDKCGYDRPTFWGTYFEDEDQRPPTSQTVRPSGRKSKIGPRIASAVYKLMDYHGDLSKDDPDWSIQADVEKAVRDELRDHAGAESTLRKHVKEAITQWRESKATEGR
jgi:hypothetical protein